MTSPAEEPDAWKDGLKVINLISELLVLVLLIKSHQMFVSYSLCSFVHFQYP